MSRQRFVLIDAETAGARADHGIATLIPDLSRRMVQHLCSENRVLRRGHPLRKSDLLALGDRITLLESASPDAQPDFDVQLNLRLETRHWIILAKPAGQPTAPRTSRETGTLANGLVARYPDIRGIGYSPLEPALLHRLDNGTSGLIVAARTPESFSAASAALRLGCWDKRYLALVQGTNLPDAGAITGSLAASPKSTRRVEPVAGIVVGPKNSDRWLLDKEPNGANALPPGAKRRETGFLVLRRLARSTLVEVHVHAAFRHQIRVHFAAAGWPLVNDTLYGASVEPRLSPQRHALHAARVAWSGNADFEGFDVSEPLPGDLVDLLPDRPP